MRRPDLPNELSSIIMRALSVDPERRFQTADELRVALDQFVANHESAASGSGLAGYMRKMFGERPEPWLERGSQRDLESEAVDPAGQLERRGEPTWRATPETKPHAGDQDGHPPELEQAPERGRRRRPAARRRSRRTRRAPA